MNELTRKIHKIFKPKAALIAYECGEGYNKDYYLELHSINENGRMGAAVPVSYDFMNALVENYSEDVCGTPHGRMPENILLCDTRRGHERYVWWNAPRRRRMYFKESLNIADGEFGVPGVVYDAKSDGLAVYAFKGGRPGMDSELYRAPFFNVTFANVCLGNAPLNLPSDPSFTDLVGCWERRFWMSEFSHLGGGNNPTKNNLVIVTENARNKSFDNEELIPHNMKLKDLLK